MNPIFFFKLEEMAQKLVQYYIDKGYSTGKAVRLARDIFDQAISKFFDLGYTVVHDGFLHILQAIGGMF
jgi:hypothetical protein